MNNQDQFGDLEASALYCTRCRTAQPVRKRLLLVLPQGDKYEYLCAVCGQAVGEKMASAAPGGLQWPPTF